jgi:hypothetical protein
MILVKQLVLVLLLGSVAQQGQNSTIRVILVGQLLLELLFRLWAV